MAEVPDTPDFEAYAEMLEAGAPLQLWYRFLGKTRPIGRSFIPAG